MRGSTVSCTVLLALVMRVCETTPTSTRASAKSRYDGAIAARPVAMPKSAAPTNTRRMRGRSRRADSRAPATDPTARLEESSPNSVAPLPNSTLAMVEVKIGKL